MGEEHYSEGQFEGRNLGDLSSNSRIFILAGLVGGILGLVSTLSSTFTTLAMWPIGPMPYSAIIAVVAGTLGMSRTLSVILLIMGVYGLSVQYKAPVLILVAALDAVVLILNEIVREYFAASGDIEAMVGVGLGAFIVGSIGSIVFGITVLGLRDRSPQPGVFTVFGLIEIVWPLTYFLVTITYVSLAYFMSQVIAILIGAILAVLYWNEYRRGPIFYGYTSDYDESSQIWE